MTAHPPEITWDDLPPQPWPEATVAPPEALADWLTSLTRPQLVWLLDRQQRVWSQDAECFTRNHAGYIAELTEHLQRLYAILRKHEIFAAP